MIDTTLRELIIYNDVHHIPYKYKAFGKGKTKVFLRSITNDQELHSHKNHDIEVVFCVAHYSLEAQTTLDQNLVLTRKAGTGLFTDKWVASMPMNEFPLQDSAQEAALKLSEWMKRMSFAIKEKNFSKIDLNNL